MTIEIVKDSDLRHPPSARPRGETPLGGKAPRMGVRVPAITIPLGGTSKYRGGD